LAGLPVVGLPVEKIEKITNLATGQRAQGANRLTFILTSFLTVERDVETS
jgi:hypothetical protein